VSTSAPRPLTSAEASRRLQLLGPNTMPAPRSLPMWRRILGAVRDPLVLVLLGAVVLTSLTADPADTIVIALVIVVNTTLAVRQELSADQAVTALARLVSPVARVLRDDRELSRPVADLVPGDLIVLAEGDLVPADSRLVGGASLQVDESALTGESMPVDKSIIEDSGPEPSGTQPATQPARSPMGKNEAAPDRVDGLLYSGTIVVHGRGLARVTATGARSELGQIAGMLQPQQRATPLQDRMSQLSRYLATGAVGLCALVMGIGLLSGESFKLMLLTAVSLAVAAVPESLPVVVTVSLALAARRMAERHAIVRNLAAVETLGSVTLLATDKTGTLTQARMAVTDTWWPPYEDEETLLCALALCNDATLDIVSGTSLGDPTETALLRAAVSRGVVIDEVRASFPRLRERPFDSSRKRMLTVHRGADGGELAICKGAPEALLQAGVLRDEPALIDTALQLSRSMAATGARVIAVARRQVSSQEPTPLEESSPEDASPLAAPLSQASLTQASRSQASRSQEARSQDAMSQDAMSQDAMSQDAMSQDAMSESGLSLVGLVQLQDPLRPASAAVIAACHEAGIDVALVTGDHPATAAHVAVLVGITADARHVVARATPADKLVLIQEWQEGGQVVAMTGDGVNDGPALRRADIGVAMGEHGTEVARQSADLILGDDDLATVIAAIEEGRRVYANIRRFLLYALSGGASEILLMLAGPLVGIPLPLVPAQILWLNLLTHSFAGAALGTEPVEAGTMTRTPRNPLEGVLGGGLWWRIGTVAAMLAAVSLWVSLAAGLQLGSSAALLSLGAGQLGVAWGVRARTGTPMASRLSSPTGFALAGAGLLLAGSVMIAPLRSILSTEQVPAAVWGLALLSALTGYGCARVLRPRTF
jgi:P-type Ca2+ transporter type 2C